MISSTSNSGTSPHTLTVSQLNRKARQLLETHLNQVWVEGELTNLATPSSGHWYFTLKDAGAQVRCAMFKPHNSRVARPKEGAQVRVRARVSLYEGRGDYQLIVESLEDSGVGALQKAFEALKKKLADEGLFNPEFKQPLPPCPRQIGVVTSPGGAAIHDILNVLKRRYPVAVVTLLPVAVQGKGAAEEIAAAIHRANHNNCLRPEVLIVGRGGGSLEDLWAFNEEVVARAIFASEIPIVSAVGHEIDFSIADFVADVRAPTPSAAAELVVPDGQKLAATFAQCGQHLRRLMEQKIREQHQYLRLFTAQIKHPGQKLREQSQHLDHLDIRLQKSMAARLTRSQSRFQDSSTALLRFSPAERNIPLLQLRLSQCGRQLRQLHQTLIPHKQQRLAALSQLLHGVSPLNTLNRGYAIVTDTHHHVIQDARSVAVGDRIRIRLKQGELESDVTSTG